jgi:tetratricopeptide (TPR) repeat protein
MQEKLLHIYYQDTLDAPAIHEYIASVPQLDEVVDVMLADEVLHGVSNAVYINGGRIHIMPDWLDKRPPLVFPSLIPFNKNFFLGIVFGMLGNEEKYPQYFTAFPALLNIFDLMQSIVNGTEGDSYLETMLGQRKIVHPFDGYVFNHNIAVALNYGHYSNDIRPEAIEAHFKDAIELAFEPAYRALTLKYYATFLTDTGRSGEALQLLDKATFKALNDYPKYALEKTWCQAAMKQLTFPLDEIALGTLKTRLWDTLQFFDTHGHKAIAAFLWMDAANISNFNNSYAESLGYINKALSHFKEEKLYEMIAQAQLIRGRVFYDWAQSGNPQFYRNALEAYQEALKIFKKEDAPDVFADIHHQLGVIYAELPDENKKRSIWAALSVTSFNEALEYYNKIDTPYQFGMICNNFGNAYTKYPQSVRFASSYPSERAVTLLNYLEASWQVNNPDGDFNSARYAGMVEKVNGIGALTSDPQLLAERDKHIALLEQLEKKMNVNAETWQTSE